MGLLELPCVARRSRAGLYSSLKHKLKRRLQHFWGEIRGQFIREISRDLGGCTEEERKHMVCSISKEGSVVGAAVKEQRLRVLLTEAARPCTVQQSSLSGGVQRLVYLSPFRTKTIYRRLSSAGCSTASMTQHHTASGGRQTMTPAVDDPAAQDVHSLCIRKYTVYAFAV